jgi:hypothetical protein
MVLVLAATFAACKPSAPAPALEFVGDPLGGWRTDANQAYARNLWDLQAFRGQLYLGHGDAIANTGPTQLLTFDPATQKFAQDTVLNEEAIMSLRVFGDRLYVPGVDAVDSPDGAVYIRDGAGWSTLRLHAVAHASDVLVHGDQICVAVQATLNGGAVRCSRDAGATWSTYSTGSFRAVSLFELGGALYVSSHDVGIQRIDGQAVPVRLELDGIDPAADVLVTRPVQCGGNLTFIAKQITYSGPSPEVRVFGLFHTEAITSGVIVAKRSTVAGTPSDLFSDGGFCYVVVNDARDAGGYDVTIARSNDGRSWQRVVAVTSDAMIRSAELMQGYFYLGTGCELGHCNAMAGRLLRVRMVLR